MKLDILIVDFLVVAAVVIPYFLFIFSARKEGARLRQQFREEAQYLAFHPEEQDQWNNNIIGLNKEKEQLLFLQRRKAGIVTEFIDLKQVQACSILEQKKSLRENKRQQEVLEKLDLQLLLNDGSHRTVTLYDCEETYSQDYELKHAEQWTRIINELVKNRSRRNIAA